MILKRTINLLKEYLNMNNIELADINNYRLNEINKTKDYFNNEINERKNIIKKLDKYLVTLEYLDRIFITLSASVRYSSRYTSWYCGCFFDLIFTIITGVNKSLLQLTKNRKIKT